MAISALSVVAALASGLARADTRGELEKTTSALEERQGQLGDAEGELSRMQDEIDRLASEVVASQQEYADASKELARTIRSQYKADDATSPLLGVVLASESLDELIECSQYAAVMSQRLSDATRDLRQRAERLQAQYDEISAKKDKQESLAASLREEASRLEDEAASLREQAEQEERNAKATEQASAGRDVAEDERASAETFETGSTEGWQTGVASAYGGWSDPSTGAVSSTATGDICDDWSMGVAVPMAWSGYRSYFGRQVEVSYNGQSVIATVNDCGSMGGGSRSLDLQPGVFKAFGFSNCDDWGLRTVSYRFL